MESFLAAVAEHAGPEWVLIIWLLWRVERMEIRRSRRQIRDERLKLKLETAIRALVAEIRSRG